jgi:hypothetical protein
MESSWRVNCVLFIAAVLLLQGCATPVGVRPLHSKEANRLLTENVLSDAKLSGPTLQILNRAGLEEQFQSEPAEVIATLHQALPTARGPDRLFCSRRVPAHPRTRLTLVFEPPSIFTTGASPEASPSRKTGRC